MPDTRFGRFKCAGHIVADNDDITGRKIDLSTVETPFIKPRTVAEPAPIPSVQIEAFLNLRSTGDFDSGIFVSGEFLVRMLEKYVQLVLPDSHNTPPCCAKAARFIPNSDRCLRRIGNFHVDPPRRRHARDLNFEAAQ